MKRSALSLKARLLFMQIAVFGVVALLGGPILFFAMSYALHRDRDAYLASMAKTLTTEYLATRAAPRTSSLPPRCLPEPVPPDSEAPGATHRPRHLLVCDPRGRVLASDGETEPLAPAAVHEAARTLSPAYADVRWSAEIFRTVAWPFRDEDGEVFVMEIGTSYLVIETVLGKSFLLLAVIGGTTLLFLILGSWFLTHRAFEPVDRVIRRLEAIDEDNLSERIPTEGRSDEIGRFIAVINGVLDRLDRAFRAQSRFSSDVAHEIRSPLTALRGQMEVALRKDRPAEEYREVLVDNLEEVLRLARLAEDLMNLARADAGILRMRHRPIDLASLLDRVVARFEHARGARRVTLTLEAQERLFVLGDSGLLGRMFDNLVDNALMHSSTGQAVTIRLTRETLARETPTREGGRAVIAVRDDGEGIPPEHLEKIFDRFYRVDKARSRDRGGTGLGLAIVRQFAWLHRGSVSVRSTVGKGSTFTVDLPLASTEEEDAPPSRVNEV